MTKKYFIPQFLLLCLFIASCSKANYEPQEYISTNINDERIELSKEIFNKLKKEHYLKSSINNPIPTSSRLFWGILFVISTQSEKPKLRPPPIKVKPIQR